VFGQHLHATMSYESQCGPQRVVPVLVELCASFIREHGLKEEGLFRAPGQTNHVRELQDAFDRGEKPVFDRWDRRRGHRQLQPLEIHLQVSLRFTSVTVSSVIAMVFIVATFPSKQAKALPSWRCSFKGSVASGAPKGKMGGSAGDVSASGGSNWLMNGLSSLRAHRRTTSSGERVKDSGLSLKDSTQSLKENSLLLKDTQRDYDLESPQTSQSHKVLHKSHRLSAYDNVAPSSLSLPADTSSIWTPFEISLSDTEGSEKATKLEQDEERTIEVGNGTNDEDVAGTSKEITNKLTQLKQELKKQKLNYETRIRKSPEFGASTSGCRETKHSTPERNGGILQDVWRSNNRSNKDQLDMTRLPLSGPGGIQLLGGPTSPNAF
ncbi:hypothetical protein GOODEAATRI_008493, partial [Goodea atripinnis]